MVLSVRDMTIRISIPLQRDKIKDVIETSKDIRLKNAQIIVSSPYTRALQTASIISKETGLDIVVEPDIREWQPDLTYQYKNSERCRNIIMIILKMMECIQLTKKESGRQKNN